MEETTEAFRILIADSAVHPGFDPNYRADISIQFVDPDLWNEMVAVDEADTDIGDRDDVVVRALFEVQDKSGRTVRLPKVDLVGTLSSQTSASWPSLLDEGPMAVTSLISDSDTLLHAESCIVSIVAVWSPSPTIETDDPQKVLWEAPK